MTDLVAIVSVVTSGAIGLAGLVSTAVGQRAARQWQSEQQREARHWEGREERVAELRAVLDVAADVLARAMRGLYEANQVLSAADVDTARNDEMLRDARAQFEFALAARNDLWLTVNRVQVRTGANSAVSAALEAVERRIEILSGFVQDRLMLDKNRPGFDAAWKEAFDAENAFYDAAANELADLEAKPRAAPSS
jgi:hypothetical protein